MEDVLDLYHLPYDPSTPLVCMDERLIQLVKETRLPIPAAPGRPPRYDYEYERNGTAVHFLFTEPLAGWRKANVRSRKTAVGWAWEIKELLDVDYPEAGKVILVCDNLNTSNTHAKASLYEAFEAAEAHRLANRLEIHHTPKHGSWLNIAEIELSALVKQCLGTPARIPDQDTLLRETKAWEQERNQAQVGVDWQFTTKDARIKLKHLYPQI